MKQDLETYRRDVRNRLLHYLAEHESVDFDEAYNNENPASRFPCRRRDNISGSAVAVVTAFLTLATVLTANPVIAIAALIPATAWFVFCIVDIWRDAITEYRYCTAACDEIFDVLVEQLENTAAANADTPETTDRE